MRVVCQVSGGADSTLAAIKARERWPYFESDITETELETEFYGIFINYGQSCAKQELQRATLIASKLKLEKLRIVDLHNLWLSGGMISGEQKENQNVYTPLRNVTLLGITLAYAESIGANIVVTGSKGLTKISGNSHSYYDSTLPFAKLMEGVWNYTAEVKRQVQIIPILAEGKISVMTKEEVYRELLNHGFGFEDTWSCFRGEEKECGECVNCKEKIRIFKKLELERK